MSRYEHYGSPVKNEDVLKTFACKKHGVFAAASCPKCEAERNKLNQTFESEIIRISSYDPAKLNDYAAYCCVEIEKQKSVRVKAPLVTWSNVDYLVQVPAVSKLFEEHGSRSLAVDATGLGEPVSEMFHKNGIVTEDVRFGEYVDYVNALGQKERAPIKYSMIMFARSLGQAGIIHLPKPERQSENMKQLVQQLYEQEIIPRVGHGPQSGESDRQISQSVKFRHPEGRHDDLLTAFLMALYVGRSWITGDGAYVLALNDYLK